MDPSNSFIDPMKLMQLHVQCEPCECGLVRLVLESFHYILNVGHNSQNIQKKFLNKSP